MRESTITLKDALEISTALSPADQLRLVAGLTDRLSREWFRMPVSSQETVPNTAVLDRAITLYRQDAITLARAAEMAGVTRWMLMHALQTRGAPVRVETPLPEEMDRDLAAYLK